MDEVYKKPTLGVQPRILWYEDRICDLSKAIYEKCVEGNFIIIKDWISELSELLEIVEKLKNNSNEQIKVCEAKDYCGEDCICEDSCTK